MNPTFEKLEQISIDKKQRNVFPVGAMEIDLYRKTANIETTRKELAEMEQNGIIGSFETINGRFYFLKVSIETRCNKKRNQQ